MIPVFFLITVGLADGLPHEVGGYRPALYWVAAVLTGLAFYASLLVHELAHAFVARRRGMQVKGIVLWLLGGMAQIDGDAPDARSELRMAGAGPLTSGAVALAAGGLAWLLSWLGMSALAVAALSWLAGINLLLAAFNLLPAFPLDGGRVLRAILWHRSGDRARATATAARSGRAIGLGVVAVGLFEAFSGNVSGLWVAFVGWFIRGAATRQLILTGATGRPPFVTPVSGASAVVLLPGIGLPPGLGSPAVAVPSSLTVWETYSRYFRLTQLTHLPVVDEAGRILGEVTLEGLHGVPGERWWNASVLEATSPMPSAHVGT